MDIKIIEGTIALVVSLSQGIPEFIGPPGVERYEERINHVPHLILIAYCDGIPAAFKVGYEREDYFYSWMGAVLPDYRGMKLATLLAKHQEHWAIQNGYTKLIFKTRNQHKGMLIFALKNGFNIIGFKPKSDILTNRILLEKVLS